MIEPQPQQRTCPRCALAVPTGERTCPKCGLAMEPGVTFLEAPTVHRSAVSEPGPDQSAAYERKVVTCLPMDLERVARAEAVDGWSLTDTTVDPDAAGSIRAHFRRAPRTEAAKQAPRSAPADRARQSADAKGGSAPSRSTSRATKREHARRPDFGPEPTAGPQLRNFLMVLLVLGTIIFLAENFGIAGLILGIIFVPGLLRSLVGGKGRRRR